MKLLIMHFPQSSLYISKVNKILAMYKFVVVSFIHFTITMIIISVTFEI